VPCCGPRETCFCRAARAWEGILDAYCRIEAILELLGPGGQFLLEFLQLGPALGEQRGGLLHLHREVDRGFDGRVIAAMQRGQQRRPLECVARPSPARTADSTNVPPRL
jgi:hypothetical protein